MALTCFQWDGKLAVTQCAGRISQPALGGLEAVGGIWEVRPPFPRPSDQTVSTSFLPELKGSCAGISRILSSRAGSL